MTMLSSAAAEGSATAPASVYDSYFPPVSVSFTPYYVSRFDPASSSRRYPLELGQELSAKGSAAQPRTDSLRKDFSSAPSGTTRLSPFRQDQAGQATRNDTSTSTATPVSTNIDDIVYRYSTESEREDPFRFIAPDSRAIADRQSQYQKTNHHQQSSGAGVRPSLRLDTGISPLDQRTQLETQCRIQQCQDPSEYSQYPAPQQTVTAAGTHQYLPQLSFQDQYQYDRQPFSPHDVQNEYEFQPPHAAWQQFNAGLDTGTPTEGIYARDGLWDDESDTHTARPTTSGSSVTQTSTSGWHGSGNGSGSGSGSGHGNVNGSKSSASSTRGRRSRSGTVSTSVSGPSGAGAGSVPSTPLPPPSTLAAPLPAVPLGLKKSLKEKEREPKQQVSDEKSKVWGWKRPSMANLSAYANAHDENQVPGDKAKEDGRMEKKRSKSKLRVKSKKSEMNIYSAATSSGPVSSDSLGRVRSGQSS
jgi:hypothetical protein